jgi:hypothetical protein
MDCCSLASLTDMLAVDERITNSCTSLHCIWFILGHPTQNCLPQLGATT